MGGVLTTITEQALQSAEQQLRREVAQRLINSKSSEVSSPGQVVVRDILPDADLESGDNNGWNGTTRSWAQNFNGVSGTPGFYDAYQINSDAKAEKKVIGFLLIHNQKSDPVTTGLKFLDGKEGDQGVQDELQTEAVYSHEDDTGVFSTSVIYGVEDHGLIQHYITAAEDEVYVYEGAVAEPVGENISRASNPLQRGGGGGGGSSGNGGA